LLAVDSGRFAHPTSAPSHDGAESVGESDHNHNEAEEMLPRSSREALLVALRQLIKDNGFVE